MSAAATLRVEDYFEHGKRAWMRLHEKGGKRHEVPCHHNLAAYLDAWIDAAGIAADKKGPLFRAIRKGNKLTENPMAREDILAMIKRRAKVASLYIAAGLCREEEKRVRQLEASRAERGRRAAGCDAPKHPEQNPDGRRSRREQASSD